MTPAEAADHTPIAWLGRELAAAVRVDDMAVQAQALVYLSVLCGQDVLVAHNGSTFPLAMSAVLVGDTSAAGKGTSARQVKRAFKFLTDGDMFWSWSTSFASGQVLIHHLAALDDIRLFWQANEFSGLLSRARARDSVLSSVLRDALDHTDLDNRAITSGTAVAKAGHYTIGVVGHVTPREIASSITSVDLANGLANRLAWFRIQPLPRKRYTAMVPDSTFDRFADLLFGPTTWHRPASPVVMWPDLDAEDRLETVVGALYDEPDLDAPPSLATAATARAMAFIVRIASLCAVSRGVFDRYSLDDLRYAEMVWAHAQRCAEELFGGYSGYPTIDAMIRELAAQHADPHDAPWQPTPALKKSYSAVAVEEAIALGLVVQHRVPRRNPDGTPAGGRPRLFVSLSDTSVKRLGLTPRPTPSDLGDSD